MGSVSGVNMECGLVMERRWKGEQGRTGTENNGETTEGEEMKGKERAGL